MKTCAARWKNVSFLALLLGVVMGASAAEPPTVRAPIQPEAERKLAPAFTLRDVAGKNVTLSGKQQQVVLLDFWATECGGCVREMPGFMDLAQKYKTKGLTVVGVSVDILYEDLKSPEEAWRKVTPFVQTHKVNYQILMGDDQVNKQYDIQALPLTYLIDTRGRIAATYIGVVDIGNVETNIQTLLKERR
jgi:peroxiredoxin